MSKIAVAVIHGIGEQKPDFADEMIIPWEGRNGEGTEHGHMELKGSQWVWKDQSHLSRLDPEFIEDMNRLGRRNG